MASVKKTEDDLDLTGDEPLEPEVDVADDDDDLGEEIPATAEGKASAARLLDLLVEKKALALHVAKASAPLIEAVAKALDWPGPVSRKATKLSDAIVESDEVDELFVDDETLAEILKRW